MNELSGPEAAEEQPRSALGRAGRGSRLGRLFTYSKDSKFAALENFTTESLAIAIADDHRPMLEALRRLRERGPIDLSRAARLTASTQRYLKGGFLDLVLDASDEHGVVLGEVWVEIKTGAPESGNQLAAYRSWAAGADRTTWLITMGCDAPLHADVPNITWMSLYSAARGTPDEHRSWRDLRAFLEEQMLASDALGPMSDSEAAAMEPAFALFQKASAVIARVHQRLKEVFPEPVAKPMLWRSDDVLLNSAAATFRRSGVFAGTGGCLTYGLTSDGGTAYWFVAVAADRFPSVTADAIRKAADGKLDLATWSRPPTGSDVVVARVRATSQGTHEQVYDWMVARLRELADSGVVAVATGMPTTR